MDRDNSAAIILRLNAYNFDQRKPWLDTISAEMLELLGQLRTTWQGLD